MFPTSAASILMSIFFCTMRLGKLKYFNVFVQGVILNSVASLGSPIDPPKMSKKNKYYT